MYPQCIFLHHPDYSDGSFYKRNWQLSSWNLATWIYRSVWCDLYIFIWDSLTSRQWRAVGCNSWSGDTLQCFLIYRSASCSRIHISRTYQHAFRTGTSIFYDFCLYFSPWKIISARSNWGISDYGRCRDCCKHPWRVITPSFPGNLFYFPIQECLGIRFNAQKMRLQLISNVALLDYL